jgi:prolyl oligopeptidase
MKSLDLALNYPSAARYDTYAEVGDLRIPDPYQWLEEDTLEVLAWQEAQNALARRYIRSWPGFETVLEGVRHHPVEGWHESFAYRAPVRTPAGWVHMTAPEGRSEPVLQVSPVLPGEGRVLVDPAALNAESTVHLEGFSASPDGCVVAYWLSEKGHEQRARMTLLDSASGEQLPDVIDHLFDSIVAGLAWLPDSSGFYYVGYSDTLSGGEQGLFFHRLGEPPPREPELALPLFRTPTVSADGRCAAVHDQLAVKPIYLRRLTPGAAWQPFLAGIDAEFRGVFVGDTFVATTTHGSPRGRLVRIPLATADEPSTWTELLSESEDVLRHVWLRAGRLLLSSLTPETCGRLRVLNLDGTPHHEVELPGLGTIEASGAVPTVSQHADRYHIFSFTSFTSSLATYQYDVETDELTQLVAPRYELRGVTARFVRCTAADGYPVTYQMIHRDDLDRSKPHPALIEGYGNGGAIWTPCFVGPLSTFIDAGGIHVWANLRGGGEHGQAFKIAGNLAQKQHTFDDVHAIAQDLIDRHVSPRDGVGVVGISGGGVMAGTAAVQRPDLFRVCVARSPLLDLIRVVRDPYGLFAARSLFGDPRDPDGARHLLTFSAYHLISEGAHYPAILFEAGSADSRCPAWHSRKAAARLQHANASSHPILLRVWMDTGHGASPGTDTAIEQTAEWLAFVMRELGMAPTAEGGSST